MTTLRYSILIAVALCYFQGAQAQPPSWNAEQSAVWQIVQNSWVDDVAENGKWPANYIHDKVVAWSDRLPAPQGKDTLVRFTKFRDAGSQTLFYDITPAAIVVEKDTAVVHYHAVYVTENEKGERERSVDQLVEVLVRENGNWRYLSLSGFSAKPSKD